MLVAFHMINGPQRETLSQNIVERDRTLQRAIGERHVWRKRRLRENISHLLAEKEGKESMMKDLGTSTNALSKHWNSRESRDMETLHRHNQFNDTRLVEPRRQLELLRGKQTQPLIYRQHDLTLQQIQKEQDAVNYRRSTHISSYTTVLLGTISAAAAIIPFLSRFVMWL